MLKRILRRNLVNRILANQTVCRNFKCTMANKSSSPGHFGTPLALGYTFFNAIQDNGSVDSSKDSKELEENIQKAYVDGEAEIIELMDVLKDCIVQACSQYRECLKKQIEITSTAMEIGPFSETWDELPEYRTLANDLNQELNNYITLLRTIGEMAYDHFASAIIEGCVDHIETISEKYKDLEVILQRELDMNRKCEVELLTLNREFILRAKN